MWKIILPLVLAVFWCSGAFGHAAPTRIVDAPLRVRGNALLDRNGFNVELSGVNVPEAVAVQPTNRVLFKVIRRRWNFNSVRLPVSVSKWARGGDAYVAEIGGAIRQANEAKLAVVLVAREDAALPSPVMLRFWTVWAERFKTNDAIVFDVFDRPSPAGIPGYSTARRDAKQWEYWLNGGTTTDGRTAIGMKHLVEAIRTTGAKQVVAVQAFSDSFGFQGLDPAHWIPDQNVIYEIHPHLNRAMTSAQRDSTFGFLSDRLHLYAGEWGFPLQGTQIHAGAFRATSQARSACFGRWWVTSSNARCHGPHLRSKLDRSCPITKTTRTRNWSASGSAVTSRIPLRVWGNSCSLR
jgi:hypothetical protein